MIRSFLPLLAATLVGVVSAQPAPTVFPAPPEVLTAFNLRDGAVQNLSLPVSGGASFDVRVVLAGVVRTLRLAPHDVRAPGFQLLIDDGIRLRQVPAAASTTYRGQVVGLPESTVAASLVDGQFAATIHVDRNNLWGVQPLSAFNAALPRESHVVYRGADVIEPRRHCGVAAPAREIDHGHGGVAPAAVKVCEIAIDVDLAYFNRYGSNLTQVQNQVTSVMNAVGVIYLRDVEIAYTVTTMIVRTTNIYTWTNINNLLTDFRNHWNANHGGVIRDVAHLFTGEGTFSGTIGLAYVGAICETFGYGVSLAYSANLATNTGLIAHEIGHNWNAGHCDAAPPCNIMCSGIGGCGPITSFSAGEIATIVAFKNTRTCLSDPGGGGGQWAEVGDAGSTPATAQSPVGAGALASISGNVPTSGDLDMYMIRIVNEAAFSATTVGATPTLGDTQLFLLDARGHGVVCNDDAGGGTRSTIDSTLVTANGNYFLAVAGYDRDVTNNGALIFANTSTGQIAANPAAGPANGTTTGTSPTGTYTIILTGCEFVLTLHAELGDAGDLRHLAQAPCGVGPLHVITGTNGANDADLYRITIDTPASFSASTCGGAGFDSQLFLLDANGRGIACNDDTCSAQSTITNALVTTPGVYYLAISNYNRDPVSLGGLIFPNASSGQHGPTGPGGALPIAGWSGTPAAGGAYTITLAGCSHAAAAVAVDFGTGAGSAPGVPSLTTTFPPQLGNSTGLTLNNPDPTAVGMALVLGLSRTSLPLLNGTLYVGDMVTVLSLPAPTLGANAIGPFRLGRSPAGCGSTVTWQMIVLVPPTASFPTGLAWTNGTEWTFGI